MYQDRLFLTFTVPNMPRPSGIIMPMFAFSCPGVWSKTRAGSASLAIVCRAAGAVAFKRACCKPS